MVGMKKPNDHAEPTKVERLKKNKKTYSFLYQINNNLNNSNTKLNDNTYIICRVCNTFNNTDEILVYQHMYTIKYYSVYCGKLRLVVV